MQWKGPLSANVQPELGGLVGYNLLWPDVALRLSHISPVYETHLSSRKQELEHRAFPSQRALSASLLFSIFILVTEHLSQTFHTGEKKENQKLLWLKKRVG